MSFQKNERVVVDDSDGVWIGTVTEKHYSSLGDTFYQVNPDDSLTLKWVNADDMELLSTYLKRDEEYYHDLSKE